MARVRTQVRVRGGYSFYTVPPLSLVSRLSPSSFLLFLPLSSSVVLSFCCTPLSQAVPHLKGRGCQHVFFKTQYRNMALCREGCGKMGKGLEGAKSHDTCLHVPFKRPCLSTAVCPSSCQRQCLIVCLLCLCLVLSLRVLRLPKAVPCPSSCRRQAPSSYRPTSNSPSCCGVRQVHTHGREAGQV